MKTGWYILTIVLMILVSGVAGYLLRLSGEKKQVVSTVPDRKFIARDDSFKKVISGKEDSLELLKGKLSLFSRTPVQVDKIAHGDSLVNDINTFQQIVRTQDTLRKIDARQIAFIRNEYQEKTNQLADLQNRYNKDVDRQKRTRVNIFLSGLGVGAGVILVAVLIL